MARLGLDTAYVPTVVGKSTGTVRVFLNEGQPDYDIVRPAAYDYPEIGDRDVQELAETQPGWIYFGTLEPMSPRFLGVMRRLLSAIPGARRLYDVNLRKESYTCELIEILLGETTVLKANDREAEVIKEMLDIRDSGDEEFCKALNARFDIECVCDPWRERMRYLEKRSLRGVTRKPDYSGRCGGSRRCVLSSACIWFDDEVGVEPSGVFRQQTGIVSGLQARWRTAMDP